MATIIISLILLVITVEEGSSGWYASFNILGTEAKEQANSLAEGCAEQAMAKLLTDPNYQGGATTTTSVGTCYTFPIQLNFPVAGLLTIKTQAVVRESYANLDMKMNMNDIHFGSIPTAPSTGTLFITTHIINDSTGSNLASDFTMNVSANPNSTFPGTESGNAVVVQPGSYAISETAILPNYTKSASSNCSGTISAGQIKFCTITYDDITTTLTLIVNVVNDNGLTNLPTDFPIFIDGNPVTLGTRTTVTAGTHTVSATTLPGYAVSPWGYDCSSAGSITMSLGQNKTCIINFNDLPPPAPTCADTVMILDRTGSMSNTDLQNERSAANALVNLYAGVLPPATPPQIGVGSIGGLYGNTPAQVPGSGNPVVGWLTTTFSTITNAVNQMTSSNSSVGSNLSAGIDVAKDELNSVRHISGKQKVIVIVSDGDPNEPSGTTNYDTGFKTPTANAQNTTGEFWTTPDLAYANLGGDANDPVSENDRHQFGNFGFGSGSGLPTGATVRGIEASVDAWATAGVTNTPGNSTKSPTTAQSPNQFTNPIRVTTSDDSYATNSTTGNAQSFGNFGFNIPSNATITGIQVTSEAKIGAGLSSTTALLFPNGQGNYTAWTNGESTVDETGTVDCSSADSILENNNNDRESVIIDMSSVPNGATINSVDVSVYDRGDSNSGGTYRTFTRINNSDTDAGSNLSATGTSSCNLKTQTISISPVVKNSGTTLEVGVVKTNGNNNTIRIGAIRANVTYTNPATGSLDIALSSNNGSTFTSSKNQSVGTTETVASPTGNTNTDMWGRSWTPADFNNGNFVLKTTNNSTNGATLSVDQVLVNVFYTVPISSGTSCQLGVDLSWNGGTSWTTEKIQNLTGTETTYTLGGATDDWSSSHSWTPGEFSNTNFKARIHAIDPGSNCDNTAIDHVDVLQFKIYYSQNVNPIEAALNSADTAKLSGIDIFTIHFGSDTGPYAGKKLLANLASGNTAVTYSPGHQNGSLADATGVTNGNTGLVSPTVNSADTGGDGNGFEINPNNAYTDGVSGVSGSAQNIDGAGDRHRFSGYNFNIPPNATITGIQTRLDWWLDSTSGTNSVNVELSWNGGTSWTTAKSDTNESTSVSNTRTLGGTTDNWGHTWTGAELSPANFRVRITTNSTASTRDFYLDWIPVTVTYTVNTENGDGDNFFVAPTSSDMQSIFNFIGSQVCPASLNLTGTPPPTTGVLNIITQVTNNNSGTKIPSDFTMNVNATNPSQTNFAGNSSGVNVTVDPGNYDVSENGIAGYIGTPGPSCSSSGGLGTITAGETRVCIVNNDDIPPPPPPPNLNFNTSSWQEVPTAN